MLRAFRCTINVAYERRSVEDMKGRCFEKDVDIAEDLMAGIGLMGARFNELLKGFPMPHYTSKCVKLFPRYKQNSR